MPYGEDEEHGNGRQCDVTEKKAQKPWARQECPSDDEIVVEIEDRNEHRHFQIYAGRNPGHVRRGDGDDDFGQHEQQGEHQQMDHESDPSGIAFLNCENRYVAVGNAHACGGFCSANLRQ